MTRKYIRKPRVPSGEDPAVTIGNQANQIKLLIERREELEAQRCMNHNDRINAEKLSETLTEEIADRREAYIRLCGWQSCAREIFELLLPAKT